MRLGDGCHSVKLGLTTQSPFFQFWSLYFQRWFCDACSNSSKRIIIGRVVGVWNAVWGKMANSQTCPCQLAPAPHFVLSATRINVKAFEYQWLTRLSQLRLNIHMVICQFIINIWLWSFFFSSHYTTPAQYWAQDLARGLNSSWVHVCGRMGQISRCFIVCSSPHSHVVCSSSLNPHFCIRDLHRPVPLRRRFRLDQVGHSSLETRR